MPDTHRDAPARRLALRRLAGAAALPPLLAVWPSAWAQATTATPSCGSSPMPTGRQTEGPYFKRSSPQRQSLLEPDLPGERLVLAGQVLDLDCRPVAGALLDFWHADADGRYDNWGYTLRGHQFADAQGRYRLETLVPGNYPGRTRHIHVKAQAPGGPVLTTQLYFPDDPGNRRDRLFRPALTISQTEADRSAAGSRGGFDFVLAHRA